MTLLVNAFTFVFFTFLKREENKRSGGDRRGVHVVWPGRARLSAGRMQKKRGGAAPGPAGERCGASQPGPEGVSL